MSGAKPSAPRVAAMRERRAALGLVRLELYVRPEHVQRIRAFAKSLPVVGQVVVPEQPPAHPQGGPAK
jgi:hypothetical protein